MDVKMYKLEGLFGKRVVGIIAGEVYVHGVNEFLNKLKKIDQENRTVSQILDAERIAGVKHLVHSAHLALVAHSTGRNFASSLGMELLCWVAAERQIARALEKVGLHRGRRRIAALVLGDSSEEVENTLLDIQQEFGLTLDDRALELTNEKFSKLAEAFSISDKELEIASIQKLVLERVAMLALEK
jgi:KEOPS complex subunit Cgi121